MFRRNKAKITKGLNDLEESNDIHSEALLSSAKRLDSELSKLKIDDIIALCEQDPEINEVYGGTVEAIMEWEEESTDRIELLLKRLTNKFRLESLLANLGLKKGSILPSGVIP